MHQCSAMDWKREEVLLLIECYRNHPCLWNSTLNIASVKTASNDTKTLKLDLENNSIRVCTHRKRQATKLSLVARTHASKFGVFTQAPCVRATNRYGIIFIRI